MLWTYIKRGFGYGVGGRIGWEVGGLIWSWLRWIVLAVFGLMAAQCTDSTVGSYSKYKSKYEQQQAVQKQTQQQKTGGVK